MLKVVQIHFILAKLEGKSLALKKIVIKYV